MVTITGTIIGNLNFSKMLSKVNSNLFKRIIFNNYIKRELQQQKQIPNEKYLKRFPLIVCKQLYDSKESQNKWYLRSAPKTGVEVNVEFVDTKPDDKSMPTLLALHGCPGSHMDFTQLVSDFSAKYRVIVPNFPDFSITENNNCFWHSAQEKAQFIRDLLKALDVQRIDCLIAHSSAIFPVSYLWLKDNPLNNEINIKSLCLLSNPGPKWFTKKGRLMTSTFVNISRIASIRRYLRGIWSKQLSKKLGIKNQIEKYDDLALLFSTYILSDTLTVDKRLQDLKRQKIPTIAVFSSRDRLFKEEIFYSLYEILEPKYENFDVFEEDNKLVQKSSDIEWIKIINIRGGGHYVFSTHWKIVHNYIEELLQRI